MSKRRTPGQWVRLTVRDYQLLLDCVRAKQHEKGGMMPEDWPDFEQLMDERWNSLWKIRNAVYISKAQRAILDEIESRCLPRVIDPCQEVADRVEFEAKSNGTFVKRVGQLVYVTELSK